MCFILPCVNGVGPRSVGDGLTSYNLSVHLRVFCLVVSGLAGVFTFYIGPCCWPMFGEGGSPCPSQWSLYSTHCSSFVPRPWIATCRLAHPSPHAPTCSLLQLKNVLMEFVQDRRAENGQCLEIISHSYNIIYLFWWGVGCGKRVRGVQS